jgi:hypothetical protein
MKARARARAPTLAGKGGTSDPLSGEASSACRSSSLLAGRSRCSREDATGRGEEERGEDLRYQKKNAQKGIVLCTESDTKPKE